MGAGASKILHHDVSAVGFEGYTVISILNNGVLDGDSGGAVRVPSI